LVEDESIVPESLTIVVYGEDGGVLRFLARRPVDAEGNVETFGLPVSSASGYEVCLRGEEVVPRVAPIGVFEPGGHAHVELLAQRGFEQQIKVSGPEGASIGGARVSIELQAEGFTASPFGQSDREGLARVRGMTPGSGFLFVDADGYRKFTSPQLQFLEPTAEPLQVTLMPAGVLEGRCLSEQGPVRDFEVVVWSADASPANFTSAVFDDRNDGSFRFEDVPIGDLLVLAFSAKHDLPRCEAVPVHVERGHSGRVELKLPTPQLGRGRLIDVTSGKAAVGGFLQLWANHGGQLQRPVGSPILVGADGRFEVTGFGPGDVRMQASAPGYSYVIVHARAHAGSTVEFGAIGIAPLQELDIELTAQEGVEHRSYEVSLTGQEWHPIQTILSGGIARFEDVSPGRWGIHVRGPGVEIDRWNDLLPGRSWKISIPISGFASLEARIEPRPGQLLPPGLSVEARALGARGDRTMRLVPVSDNGVARFEALEPGRHALFLLDSRKLEIGSTEVEVGYVDTTAVLPMGDAQLSVLVVSPRGLPLSGVHVQLDGAGVDSPWCQARETDRDGAATFSAVSPGAYLAGIWHSEFGWRVGIPIHVAQVRASTIQLAFEDSYELQVKLLEDGHPLPGVQVHVRDAAGRYPLVSQVSDDDGRIAHPSLARGSYALIVDQPGFWPSMAIVTLDRSREDAIMNVRSTGSLEVSWPSSPSEVLLGGSLELVDLTSAEGVSNWLPTGRIESSTGSMTADSSGRLLLEGLPRGLYRWSISGGPADGLSGEVEVTRHAKAELSISGS
jgi:hypothetical protein